MYGTLQYGDKFKAKVYRISIAKGKIELTACAGSTKGLPVKGEVTWSWRADDGSILCVGKQDAEVFKPAKGADTVVVTQSIQITVTS